jgi:cytochrome P450
VDGHVIPAGCDIGVDIYAIHHDESYFPEPFLFNPARWLANDEGGVEKDRFGRSAWNTVSTGPRSCISGGLAMAELMLINH